MHVRGNIDDAYVHNFKNSSFEYIKSMGNIICE